MKVAVQDASALQALKPLEVAAYLRAKGWHREAELDGRASLWLWRSANGEEADVTLPLDRKVGDFTLRMGELVRTLAEAEQRSQLDVLQDLLTISFDLVRVRTASRDAANSGTLPIQQAVAFVEQSRDMMLAAACAALDKRAYFATRKPDLAMDYLGRVRLGQTERGSYVLTILSPVAPELKRQEELPLPGELLEPYERQVTRVLLEALTALDEAARQAATHGDMMPFHEAVNRGVSANLCDVVVGLSNINPAEGFDVSVSWSRSRPVSGTVPDHVRFGSDSIPIIDEASRLFRETATIEDFEVEGIITRLARGPLASEGDVTITGIADGQMRSIAVSLGTDTYSQAVQAHDERRRVRCTGDLAKEGRGYRLQSPRHFHVLQREDTG